MKKRIHKAPTLNPLAKIGVQRFLAELETAPFISREFNKVLPECLAEALRIIAEVKKP